MVNHGGGSWVEGDDTDMVQSDIRIRLKANEHSITRP